MKNKTSIQRAALLHPSRRDNFIAFIDEIEATYPDIDSVLIVQGFRTFAEQDALYAQGRTTPGHRVTAAKGGQSFHCFGLAVDICPFVNGKLDWEYEFAKFAGIAQKYGLTWGAAWHDYDHFEDNCGQGPSGWRWALNKYNAKDFIPGTTFINLDK